MKLVDEMQLKTFQGEEDTLKRGKEIALALLLLFCIVITYYFHFVERTDVVFSHFFYVPIALAGFWWGRRAIWVAVFLGVLLLASHTISGIEVSYTSELLRIVMFFVVSILVGTLREQLKTEEQELQTSEEKYRSLVESTEDLIQLVDRDCRYLFINNALLSRFCITKDQIIGRNYSEFHSPEETEAFTKRIKRVFETGNSMQDEHKSHRDSRYFFRTLSPVKDLKGEVAAVTIVSKDITERNLMESEILAAKEDAELYLDIMSHDINNFNQIGLGYLELLLDSKKLDEEQWNYAIKSLDSVYGSIKLIRDVRLLQQAKEPSEFRDINLNEIISAVIEDFSTNPYKKVDLKYTPKAGLVVNADPLIKEIFVNFIGNSIKYSGESVEIGIGVGEVTRNGREFYRVCVEDNGDGVPDNKKQVIFRRFERGADKASGKGLGLYIVKRLVEKYGGEVTVEDRIERDYTQGARFCFTIPKKSN